MACASDKELVREATIHSRKISGCGTPWALDGIPPDSRAAENSSLSPDLQDELGLSYSTQRYDGGNFAALRGVTDGSRIQLDRRELDVVESVLGQLRAIGVQLSVAGSYLPPVRPLPHTIIRDPDQTATWLLRALGAPTVYALDREPSRLALAEAQD